VSAVDRRPATGELPEHAVMTAMMYVALRDLKARGVRIARVRTHSVFDPTGA
jgi:hypothetical protein